MGCAIAWSSKIQTQIALSTTEAEYIAISMAMREVIPISKLLDKLKDKRFLTSDSPTKIYCKVFEDSSGALEMARAPKMRPRTKHVNIIYYCFLEHIKSKKIRIYPISTDYKIADISTKPLPIKTFIKT